jgi:hypothetical protein
VDIKQKIKSLIRNAIFKALAPDGSQQTGDFSFLGVEQRGVIYSPYGLYSNPKKNSFSVLLQSGAKEDSIIALVWNPKDRPDLDEGGVALQSDSGKMSVICHPDGKLELKGETQEVLAVVSSALGNISSFIENLQGQQLIATGACPSGGGNLTDGKAVFVPNCFDADKEAIDLNKTNLDTMKK